MLKYLLIALLLVGCSDKPKPDRAARKQERIEAAKVIVKRTPQPKTYRIDGHQLIMVELPESDDQGYIEAHKCFIWRDAEYKTATMSCPNAQEAYSPELNTSASLN